MISSQILHEMSEFKPIYNWFRSALLIVLSKTKFIYANCPSETSMRIGEALRLLGTGIEKVKMTPASFKDASLSKNHLYELKKSKRRGGGILFT